MAKRNVKFTERSYYHIYNRGCNRQKIFYEEENYIFLLGKMKMYADEFNISILAYCLMANHYHFFVRQNSKLQVNIFMQRIFNSYSKAINKRYNRTGTLFEGPFKAIKVEGYDYMKELCRYIHRNPLDDRVVKNIEGWNYSNYLEWIEKRNGTLFEKEFRDMLFLGAEHYKNFVTDYISSKQFYNQMNKFLEELMKRREKTKKILFTSM